MAEKKHNRKFLKTFFSERKQVGAVAPSSRFLVNSMCNKINFNDAKVIVELGPGTGVFTSELLKRASKDCEIILFELNDTFYDMLKEKFKDSRLTILNESADKVLDVLKDKGIDKADAVLSSLPLTVIPDPVKTDIVNNSHECLKDGGVYVQYQYSLNAKKKLEGRYGNLKLGFVPVNIPPAFVYTCIKS